jgi:hypothetical protein
MFRKKKYIHLAKMYQLISEGSQFPELVEHIQIAQKYTTLYEGTIDRKHPGNFKDISAPSADEIKAYCQFLENLFALQKAIKLPENDPKNNPVITQYNNGEIKQQAIEFIPLVEKMMASACDALKFDWNADNVTKKSSDRLNMMTYLSKTLQYSCAIVNDKFQHPEASKPLLQHLDLFNTKGSRIKRFCTNNPVFAETFGIVTIFAGIVLTFGAAALLPVIGPVSIALIFAGLALTLAAMEFTRWASKLSIDPKRERLFSKVKENTEEIAIKAAGFHTAIIDCKQAITEVTRAPGVSIKSMSV